MANGYKIRKGWNWCDFDATAQQKLAKTFANKVVAFDVFVFDVIVFVFVFDVFVFDVVDVTLMLVHSKACQSSCIQCICICIWCNCICIWCTCIWCSWCDFDVSAQQKLAKTFANKVVVFNVFVFVFGAVIFFVFDVFVFNVVDVTLMLVHNKSLPKHLQTK